MSNEYPPYYAGPKAGQSTNDEWLAVRDYDAFKLVRDGIWSYSDFDCYLYAMCAKHHELGENKVHNMFKEMYKITGILQKD